MKKFLLLSSLTLFLLSACSSFESKEKSMNKEDDWKVIAKEIKEVLKDKKDLYLISFNAKEKMRSSLESVTIHYKKDANTWEYQTYLFEEKKWEEITKSNKPTMVTYFNGNDVDLDVIAKGYKNGCAKIIEGEKFEKDTHFALNKISIMGNNSIDLMLQKGLPNREYLEFRVSVNKDGTVTYKPE